MKIHQASCNNWHGLTVDEFPVEKLKAAFGTAGNRWFLVKWLGYDDEEDTWEPERSLSKQGCQDSIAEFWRDSGLNPGADFIPDPAGVWRCYTCGKGYKQERTLKAHITRTHKKRQWHGSTADKDTRVDKLKKLQQQLPRVTFDEAVFEVEENKEPKIDNVWIFKYLGSRFRADGSQHADIQARIAAATKAAGQMRNIWAAKSTPLRLKMRIYKTGVCSKLVYGSEAWTLDDKACKMLNGANSKMVARVTGRPIRDEATKGLRTFDIIAWIRARRLQWMGHILRLKGKDEQRLIHKAVEYMYANRKVGDLLIDIPPHRDWDDLKKKASDRTAWRRLVRQVRNDTPPAPKLKITISAKVPGKKLARPKPKTTTQVNAAVSSKQRIANENKKKKIKEAHALLFSSPRTKRARQAQQKTKTKTKKEKRARPLTTRERQDAARAQWAEQYSSAYATHYTKPLEQPRMLQWPPDFSKKPLHKISTKKLSSKSKRKKCSKIMPKTKSKLPPPPPAATNPPPPTTTTTTYVSPTKHRKNMQQLRLQRRKRFRKKSPRKKRQPPQQTPSTAPTPCADPAITNTTAPYTTPTNDIYNGDLIQLCLDLNMDPNPDTTLTQP